MSYFSCIYYLCNPAVIDIVNDLVTRFENRLNLFKARMNNNNKRMLNEVKTNIIMTGSCT